MAGSTTRLNVRHTQVTVENLSVSKPIFTIWWRTLKVDVWGWEITLPLYPVRITRGGIGDADRRTDG